MRHWSLYEALYHSSYIASRLGERAMYPKFGNLPSLYLPRASSILSQRMMRPETLLVDTLRSATGLYQTKGRTKLDEWLARMGIPLEECKQAGRTRV